MFKFVRCVSMQSVIDQPSITITGATDASNEGGGYIISPYYGSYKFEVETNHCDLMFWGIKR